MNTLDILLIFIIGFIFLQIFIKSKSNKIIDTFDSSCPEDKDDDYYLNTLFKYSLDDMDKYINPIFVEGQFHTDYRDTITAFNNIAPSQKQIFNQANIPIQFTNPPVEEVKSMVKDFMKELNKNIMEVVPDFRNAHSGWDEVIPEMKVQSGWEKQMKALGLPSSLYPEPGKREKAKLIAIDHVEKYETDDEIKYVCYLFLQKKSIKDQMAVKVSFVMNKRETNLDRKFFEKQELDTQNVIIEEIFILGFLQREGLDKTNKRPDDFYNFKGLENQEILDQKTIIKELIKKYRERSRDVNDFNSAINGFNASLANFNGPLDPETKQFRDEVPHLRNSKSYQVTQTIYDDLEKGRLKQFDV
jgi:hypothetical protein